MLFKGFDIPLHMLSGEKFEQPILFGANNLSGIVQTNVAHAGPVGACSCVHQICRETVKHQAIMSACLSACMPALLPVCLLSVLLCVHHGCLSICLTVRLSRLPAKALRCRWRIFPYPPGRIRAHSICRNPIFLFFLCSSLRIVYKIISLHYRHFAVGCFCTCNARMVTIMCASSCQNQCGSCFVACVRRQHG